MLGERIKKLHSRLFQTSAPTTLFMSEKKRLGAMPRLTPGGTRSGQAGGERERAREREREARERQQITSPSGPAEMSHSARGQVEETSKGRFHQNPMLQPDPAP